MFEKSFLPQAAFEFVVVSDTHYMLDPGGRSLEFANRRKQAVRREVALRMVAALSPTFVVHNGDMIQEYPDNLERFFSSMEASIEQVRQAGIAPHYVAGNHDIGDKPDPTVPAPHVNREFLDWYHQRFGASWYSFDQANCHFVVLNSQIMNGSLPDVAEQQKWAEQDLAENAKKRIFIFLHLPPYLVDENEASTGHYDNLAHPARGWLLELVRRYKVEILLASHVHFSFFDHVAGTRYLVLASPVFTRPGFSHLFASPPPPERGRDDIPKFGFYLMRVRAAKTDFHFIRTYGAETAPLADTAKLITRVSGTLSESPLGITLTHPLSTVAEVPIAWPAAVREKVRNDYPLLSCMEMGVGWVRTPFSDFRDTFQRRRLAILREEGVKVNAVTIFSDEFDIFEEMEQYRTTIDGLELQIAGDVYPSEACLDFIKAVREQLGLPLTLSPILSREPKSGKQFPRFRLGYTPRGISLHNEFLAENGVRVDRAICKLNSDKHPWNQIRKIVEMAPSTHIANIDFALEFSSTDDQTNANLAAEALFSAAIMPGSRIHFVPFIDFDRTMDVTHGLLDTLCNPRPASCALQSLNTILYSQPLKVLKAESKQVSDLTVLQISTDVSIYTLLSSSSSNSRARMQVDMEGVLALSEDEQLEIYQLSDISLQRMSVAEAKRRIPATLTTGPVLIAQANMQEE